MGNPTENRREFRLPRPPRNDDVVCARVPSDLKTRFFTCLTEDGIDASTIIRLAILEFVRGRHVNLSADYEYTGVESERDL